MSMANQSRTELPTVHEMDFRGDRLLLVDVDGKPYVVLRPALEALGLDYPTQFEKLRRRSWATVGQSPTVAADGRVREMVTVDVRTFLMLLATVDEGRVSDAVRPKLVAYQAEVADAIEAYWTKGVAINPRATPEEVAAALHEHQLRMLATAHAAKLVDPAWLEAKTRHVLARALGEEPEVDPARRPLTVGDYLEEKGVHGAQLRRLRRDFGIWVKTEYRSQYGCNPPMVPRYVDGAERDVCGYTEAHRPLFDAVWATRCGVRNADGSVVAIPALRLSDPTRGRRGRPA
jgi:hypothetical protein